MANRRYLLLIAITLAAGGYWAFAPDRQGTGTPAQGDFGGQDEPPPDSTVIGDEAARAAGIEVETAGPGIVSEAVTLSGRITLNRNTTAQVKARFPGVVREVTKGQGDAVSAGEVLATVESNDSLQRYAVKSPVAGVVLARNTNVGDVAGDAPLFTVADVSGVWAEFHVFPRDIDKVAAGQPVRVTGFEGRHSSEGEIDVILPLAEASSQTVVARVPLANGRGLWRAGMTVRGDVVVAEREAAVTVRTPALQRMEGKTVVFVRDGDRYAVRPVKTGLSDPDRTEVIDGLLGGETYVSANSFLVKADIGKAGAADEE